MTESQKAIFNLLFTVANEFKSPDIDKAMFYQTNNIIDKYLIEGSEFNLATLTNEVGLPEFNFNDINKVAVGAFREYHNGVKSINVLDSTASLINREIGLKIAVSIYVYLVVCCSEFGLSVEWWDALVPSKTSSI